MNLKAIFQSFSRYSFWIGCGAAAILFAAAASSLSPMIWISCFFALLFFVGVYDLFQSGHTLWRNFPIVARARWMLEKFRPYLRQYIVQDDFGGRPFNRKERSLVYARAKGDEDLQPFGSELDVYTHEYEWLTQTMSPCEPLDEDLRVSVGGPQCTQPYSVSLLNISAMSFGSLGGKAIEAMNLGAKQGNFYHDTGEGGISQAHKSHNGDLVWEIGTGYFGCRTEDGGFDPEKFRESASSTQIKMIEIKISQGAKPGHGGVLPGPKVTEEVAAARGVEAGNEVVSPAAHSTFSIPVGLMNWVAELRELSGGKPIGIKLCVGQPHEVFALVKAMTKTGILLDFIVVDGGEGGTGAAPKEFANHLGMPLREGLIIVRNALVASGLKKHIRLAASGKVHSAFSIASNCAIGADWCNAARAFMFTVGCVQSMKCHTGECPTGVATQDVGRQRGLVVPVKAERVEKFHRRTLSALKELIAAAGLQHTSQLRPWHLYHRKDPTDISTIDELFPFLVEGDLDGEIENKQYAAWWKKASPDSFKANEAA